MMWRHGDIMIAAVEEIPAGAETKPGTTLAHGEMTGHSHRIEAPGTAEIYERNGNLYVRVLALEARVVHEEHKPITLPRGDYRFWYQREYTPQAIRRIVD
ncbi:MAG: hypothetical protein ABIY70_21755 [Capsulimonas sp.]|uniref:hypothetical protein n=1 Tax=Capsulimonas sp. TaxID=2494211 RepID=UPI0032671FDE